MILHIVLKGFITISLAADTAGFATPRANHGRLLLSPPLFSTTSYRPSDYLDYLPIDIDENASRNILSFGAWANEYGIQRANGFQLVEEDDGKDVHAITSMYVPSGTQVLYVPESLILSSNKAIAELRTPEMEEAEQFVIKAGAESELREYYLMLKILQEVQNGKNSIWYPWLQSLPRYFSNAVAMTEYCLLCLPPLMRKLAMEERGKQRRLSPDTIEMVPFIGDDIKSHPGDLFKWAYQIVATRAVDVDGDLRIVPMADYFNHGSDYTEIEASYDAAGNYNAYTSYDVPAGQQLRISYADPRNPSHLFARYGFLDENCPATYCKLLPPTVNSDMIELGYSLDRMLFYKNGEVADEVWDIFLYQHLAETNNIYDQQALMNAYRQGDYDAKLALHNKHYAATSAALLKHIDDFIEEIDKLIQKAETIGVSDPNSVYIRYEHPRLPLIHRHNLFVRETFQNVRNRYSPDQGANWREATRVLVQECDEVAMECAMAECVQDAQGNWECTGGLGPNVDGSERLHKTQRVIG
eukprot:CAMPEP_0183717688 /NCGR_PEP_ID=MMETSP0737-20130205/11225_1 /TAXON_ID=385413 /ORGANISM="Thalassiosira miniscula, Strain CCMP1093" /LENGTH=526 /DNA_ID=CAMNT_0025947165 /DNA_START=68 /DNA_END=1648 /DNA_ORIENTATION=+